MIMTMRLLSVSCGWISSGLVSYDERSDILMMIKNA